MLFSANDSREKRESKNIFPSDTQSAILLLPGFSAFYIAVRNRFSYTWSESCAESTENVELLFISLCFPYFYFTSTKLHTSTHQWHRRLMGFSLIFTWLSSPSLSLSFHLRRRQVTVMTKQIKKQFTLSRPSKW